MIMTVRTDVTLERSGRDDTGYDDVKELTLNMAMRSKIVHDV
jgi:hypothetical protein